MKIKSFSLKTTISSNSKVYLINKYIHHLGCFSQK